VLEAQLSENFCRSFLEFERFITLFRAKLIGLGTQHRIN
jgi:hypothetical protein